MSATSLHVSFVHKVKYGDQIFGSKSGDITVKQTKISPDIISKD